MKISLNDVVSNVILSSRSCSKYLENDGISTRLLLLRGFDNEKLISYKDVKALKNNIPSAGLALTIIKNFDEYQYIICNYVPKLKDNNLFKIKFQKIRILVFLFFYDLSSIFAETQKPQLLERWIKEANRLLMETSQIILDYRESLKDENINSNFNSQIIVNKNDKLKQDYFTYFDTDENKVDSVLYSIYGIESD